MLDRDVKLQIISAACKDYQDKLCKLRKMEEAVKQTETAITSLWKYFDLCPKCRGEKQYFQRSCAEDEGEIRPCKCCGGTGKFPANGVPEMYYHDMFNVSGGKKEKKEDK